MSRITPNNNLDDVDIKQYPAAVFQIDDSHCNLTLGDLHGNSLLMLYFLVRNDILTLKNGEKDYQNFVKLYDEFFAIVTSSLFLPENQFDQTIHSIDPTKDPTLKSDGTSMQNSREFYIFGQSMHQHVMFMRACHKPIDLNYLPFQFRLEEILKKYEVRIAKIIADIKKIIDTATVTEKARKIRFIGDMLADRGACDLFTLQILNKLTENPNVTVTILVSNHDFLFFKNWVLKKNIDFKGVQIATLQAFSMQTLFALVKMGFIKANDIDAMSRDAYLPRLKIADYSTNKISSHLAEFRIYTHAPFNIQIFSMLANKLSLEPRNIFADEDSLKKAIDEMNGKFQAIILKDLNANHPMWQYTGALYNFVWNRQSSCPKFNSSKKTVFVHGHEGVTNASSFDSSQGTVPILNLNSRLGQGLLDLVLTVCFDVISGSNEASEFSNWYRNYFTPCIYVDCTAHPIISLWKQKQPLHEATSRSTSTDQLNDSTSIAVSSTNSGAAAPAASNLPLPPHLRLWQPWSQQPSSQQLNGSNVTSQRGGAKAYRKL